MDNTTRQWQVRKGATVYADDGDKVGKVAAVDPYYIVVEKGLFFPTDYYVPTSAIASATEDDLYLTVSKDEALNSGWNGRPGEATWRSTAKPSDYATRYAAATSERSAEDATLRVPVHEEELTATTRPVELGTVRIEKDVVAEERSLEVPVTEERVRVTRRAVDRDGVADGTAFAEGTIEVAKEAVHRTERVGGTGRREEVHVADETIGTRSVDDGTRTDPSQ